MRCPACQVDLNETASLCPLCGGRAADIPPLIERIAYQDYPAYEHKRFQRSASLIYFFSSACVFLLAAGLEFWLTGRLHLTPYLAFAFPCVWALLIRLRKNSLSVGNYLLGCVFTVSLLLFWIGHVHNFPVASVLSSGVAVLTLMASTVLLLVTLLRRRHRERHLVFLLIFLVLSAVEFGAALWEGTAHNPAELVLSACALGLSLVSLAVLCTLCGKALLKELKARFHF